MKDKDEMFDDFRFDDDDDLDFDINDDDSLDKPIFDVHFDVDDTPYPPVTLNPGKRIVGGMTLERAEFTDRTFSEFELNEFTLYNVAFRNCTFDRIYCESGKFIACKFEDCNIISFAGEGYRFRDCEFIRCKWSGNECMDDDYFYYNCEYTDCTDERG